MVGWTCPYPHLKEGLVFRMTMLLVATSTVRRDWDLNRQFYCLLTLMVEGEGWS